MCLVVFVHLDHVVILDQLDIAFEVIPIAILALDFLYSPVLPSRNLNHAVQVDLNLGAAVFLKITRFLEGILMKHTELICSLESLLFFNVPF